MTDDDPMLVSLQIDVKNNLYDTRRLKDITAEIQYSTGSFKSIRSDAMALKEELTPPRLSDSYYCDIDADVVHHPGGRDWIYEGYTLTIQTETTEDDVLSVLNDVILDQ
jgi:hypothetical protein